MRIKKISPTTPANGNIENQYGTSQTNAYSEAYANTTFATKDVATTSANGLMSSTDKAKLDNGEVYSTTEQVVGTFIDGKPLYRKIITDTLPDAETNGTFAQKNISISSLNVDSKFIENGYFYLSLFSNIYEIPINTSSHDDINYRTVVSFYSSNIEIRNSYTRWNSAPLVLSLLYTKKTN